MPKSPRSSKKSSSRPEANPEANTEASTEAKSVITPEVLEKLPLKGRKSLKKGGSQNRKDGDLVLKTSAGSQDREVTPDSPDSDQDPQDPDSEIEAELEGDPSSSARALLAPSEDVHEDEQSSYEVTESSASGIAAAQHNLLKQYLAEVSKYKLLAPEEEFRLAVQLKESGDIDAARQLVRANLRLVVKIAMEYRSAYQNIMDLIQEGNIGLMKAVSKFDPSKGAKLSYYAGWWIRSYILKYILDNFRLVRVGTTQAQKKLFFHLMREKERLEAQGLNPGPKLLADMLHVREQDVVEMEQRLSGRGAEMSLDTPMDSSGEGQTRVTHMDMLVDKNTSPDDALEQTELKTILKSRLDEFAKTLKEKELAVFRERLASDSPKTLQEVADQFGLTRERARQIEAQVIEKLREYYKKYIR